MIAALLAHLAADTALPGSAAAALSACRQSVRRRARGHRQTLADAGGRFRSPSSGRSWRRTATAPTMSDARSGKHHHKELRRRWRRLSETGRGAVQRRGRSRGRWPGALRFLALEAGGWKGRAGTAVGRAARPRQFHARGSRAVSRQEGKVSIHRHAARRPRDCRRRSFCAPALAPGSGRSRTTRIRAFLAWRHPQCRNHRRTRRRRNHRAHRLMRHRQPPDDRSSLARTAGALQSPDRCPPASAVLASPVAWKGCARPPSPAPGTFGSGFIPENGRNGPPATIH